MARQRGPKRRQWLGHPKVGEDPRVGQLELAFLLLKVFLVQRLDFLQVHSKTMEFDTCVHIIVQMVTFLDFPNSCCCKKILHTGGIYPSSFCPSKHKLSTCLQEFDLLSQFDLQFEGDTLN
jgi:hypothetical protein